MCSHDAVDLDFRKLYFAASFMLESAEGVGEEEGQHGSPEVVTGMQQQFLMEWNPCTLYLHWESSKMEGDSAAGQEEQLFSQPSSQVIIATTAVFLSI